MMQEQAFAAGYVEGALTHERIYELREAIVSSMNSYVTDNAQKTHHTRCVCVCVYDVCVCVCVYIYMCVFWCVYV